MKKNNITIIVVVVVVFVIIAIVAYFFTRTNANDQIVTRTTEQNGLGQLFSNTSNGWISAIFANKKQQEAEDKNSSSGSGQVIAIPVEAGSPEDYGY